MNKTALLAATAAFALTAGGASAARVPVAGAHTSVPAHVFVVPKGGKVLYDQNSATEGVGLVSQNFTSGSYSPTYNAAGADDFVVPKKSTWTVTGVDVTGIYFNGYGPAASEDVTFYKNSKKKNIPGKAVKGGTFTDLKGTDTDGSFAIDLGKKGVQLKSGTYWVSVVANCSFIGGCGEWGWDTDTTIHGNPAMWQNPDGGFGTSCSTWGTIGSCLGYTGDFAFELLGKAKK